MIRIVVQELRIESQGVIMKNHHKIVERYT